MDITNERLENLEQGLENKVDEIKRLTNDNMMQNKHISDQDQTIKDLRDKSQTQDQINKELFHQLEELKLM
jgi:predicted RNase H-like nuclease (RuvC/YqgF family)